MTHINDLFSDDDIREATEAKHLLVQTHPEFDLTIYNYSSICQITRAWTPVTSACRGLIVASDGEVLARPFPKFFNHSEVAVPKFALTTPPIVTEKMDGSLGVIYKRPDGRFAVATRGSFMSDQAVWATTWLNAEMPEFTQPEGVTTLVEIIFPENRIVVNYGDRAELVLLGAVSVDTGADIPLWEIDWWPGSRTEQHVGLGDMDMVHRHIMESNKDGDDAEGIVAVWYKPNAPSFRLKVKSVDYVRLHRIITGINSKRVWEVLANGGDFMDVLDRVPDEFYGWVKGTIRDLNLQFKTIEDAAYEEFTTICHNTPDGDRRAFAAAAKKSSFPGLMFSLLDGKNLDKTIWAMIKPIAEKPFVDREEES